MSTPQTREAHRLVMIEFRKRKAKKKRLAKGTCPEKGCGMRLLKRYEYLHTDCPWYKEQIKTIKNEL